MGNEKTNPTQNTNYPTSGSSKKQTMAVQIINEVLNGKAILFHDQHDESYIAPNGDGSKILKLSSKEFRSWVAHQYWTKANIVIPRDADKQIVQTLTATALFDGPRFDLSIRLSKTSDSLFYDLANGKVVCVSPCAWSVVDSPPIMFRRVQQKEQVEPSLDGELEMLRPYVNVDSEEDWLLFLVYLIAAFVPDFPHPILILHGPQGAGKTTPMRIIKELVDPSLIQGVPLPNKVSEFVQFADHHAFLFFDNLSKMPTEMSDALARASTGDSFSRRQLYTDSDDVVFRIQKTIALNGINQVITKPDLLDRAILIKLRRITQEERIPEEDFWSAFHSEKKQILGAIFDVLSRALYIYPDITLDKVPRMADFTHWGCAISEAIGYKKENFINAYSNNIKKQNEEAIEASPVAKATIAFISDHGNWRGSAEELLEELNHRFWNSGLSSSPLWPKAPEWMTRRLNDVEVNLNAVGVRIDFERTKEGRMIILTKDVDSSSITEPDDSKSASTVDY